MSDEVLPVDAEDHARTELVGFIRGLRRRGVDVPANAGITGIRALATIGLADRDRVRTALRSALLTDRSDFETFDHLFGTFWSRLTDGVDPGASEDTTDDASGAPSPVGADAPSPDRRAEGTHGVARSTSESFDAASGGEETAGEPVGAAVYSETGAERGVGRAPLPTTPDLAEAFDTLDHVLSERPGRRYRAGDDRPDPRRVLRKSVSTGGTVLSVPTRERRPSAVSALVLVDVSRSVLDTIDEGLLLEFLRRAVGDWRNVRVFFFDEDIREVTDEIDPASATAARRALDEAETMWGGGTQIGGSIARLHERAPEVADRRTFTFVISDGLEMGDVDELERELSWLSGRTRRILWLNPLAAADSYEPTARGMAAALPYLDGLFAFASPEDVHELARQLRRQGAGGRIGYRFDSRTTATGSHNA